MEQETVKSSDVFWWGVANASFQVEGQPAPSNWSEWVAKPGNVEDGSNANQGTGFWAQPEKDFELAQQLGAKMFRLSIAWERVNPLPGVWDETALDRYEQMLMDLRRRGIEPMVTLQHFVFPLWLSREDGLLSPNFSKYFQEYALKVVRRLSMGPAKVRYWMTFNEPMIMTYSSYQSAEFPPNIRNRGDLVMEASANIARAHLETMKLLRDPAQGLPEDLQFSVAAHLRDFQSNWLFGWLAWCAAWVFNWQFLHAVQTGRLLFWAPGSRLIRENVGLPKRGKSLDFLAINYYGRMMINPTWKPPFLNVYEGSGPRTDLGWEMYPRGLGNLLRSTYRLYKLPILISENGLADAKDAWRKDFLKQHIDEIRQARKKGIPVMGYLHWTLTDNFEWHKGLSPRFGLVELDHKTGQRKPRPSFETYREIISKGI